MFDNENKIEPQSHNTSLCTKLQKQILNMSNESIDAILSNIRDNASSQYEGDFFNEHYKVHNNFPLCDKKQIVLIEYYKKREQWTDASADDLETEYKACINMLYYIIHRNMEIHTHFYSIYTMMC